MFDQRGLGVVPLNAADVFIFRTGDFQRRYNIQSRKQRPHQLTVILPQLHGQVGDGFGGDFHHNDGENHVKDPHQSQQRTVKHISTCFRQKLI